MCLVSVYFLKLKYIAGSNYVSGIIERRARRFGGLLCRAAHLLERQHWNRNDLLLWYLLDHFCRQLSSFMGNKLRGWKEAVDELSSLNTSSLIRIYGFIHRRGQKKSVTSKLCGNLRPCSTITLNGSTNCVISQACISARLMWHHKINI